MTKIRPSVDWQQDGAADGQSWKFDSATGLYVPFTPAAIVTAGHGIQDEGSPLSQRGNLNFVGAGVTVTDDAANNANKVTVTASVPTTVRDNLTATGGETIYVPGATPIDQSNPLVWKNDAILWSVEDYTYSGFNIIFPSVLANGDVIKVWYLTSGTAATGSLVPPTDPTKSVSSVRAYASTLYASGTY